MSLSELPANLPPNGEPLGPEHFTFVPEVDILCAEVASIVAGNMNDPLTVLAVPSREHVRIHYYAADPAPTESVARRIWEGMKELYGKGGRDSLQGPSPRPMAAYYELELEAAGTNVRSDRVGVPRSVLHPAGRHYPAKFASWVLSEGGVAYPVSGEELEFALAAAQTLVSMGTRVPLYE